MSNEISLICKMRSCENANGCTISCNRSQLTVKNARQRYERPNRHHSLLELKRNLYFSGPKTWNFTPLFHLYTPFQLVSLAQPSIRNHFLIFLYKSSWFSRIKLERVPLKGTDALVDNIWSKKLLNGRFYKTLLPQFHPFISIFI